MKTIATTTDQGLAAIATFLHTSAAWRAGRRFRLVPTAANG